MTSRRGTLIEQGARELLQFHRYAVRVIPFGFNKRFPPVHLVATRPSGPSERRNGGAKVTNRSQAVSPSPYASCE
jgi:hypothetical protein